MQQPDVARVHKVVSKIETSTNVSRANILGQLLLYLSNRLNNVVRTFQKKFRQFEFKDRKYKELYQYKDLFISGNITPIK